MTFCRACPFAVLIVLAACAGRPSGEIGAATTGPAIEIAFADVLVPGVLEIETEAAIAAADETGGLWAAVPGLPRPERGRLLSPETGHSVVVPLFRGNGPRISNAAAAALGLGDRASAPLSIVAVRSQIQLVESAAVP